MGLLDDAIREHLELKRRHGADPGEVARLEHEALGPVRRPAQEPADVGDEDEHAGTVVTASEPADDHDAPKLARGEAPVPPTMGEVEQPTQHLAEVDEPTQHADGVEQPTQHFDAHDVGDPPDRSPVIPGERHERPGPADDAEVEEIVAADEEPEPDDVLEETPEFLQETPEHERLWFEQKPPRDFDF